MCLITQSWPTLCDPMHRSPPGSSVHGDSFQARILGCVAMPSSRGSSQPRDRSQVSIIPGRFFTVWATREVQREGVCPQIYVCSLLLVSSSVLWETAADFLFMFSILSFAVWETRPSLLICYLGKINYYLGLSQVSNFQVSPGSSVMLSDPLNGLSSPLQRYLTTPISSLSWEK